MATSSFFFNGSNEPDETQTQTPPTTTESGEDTVKTSFYYGSTPGPDQNTFNDLVNTLNEKVAEADEDRVAAQAAASAASNSASSAANTAASIEGEVATAETARAAAEAAKAAASSSASSASTSASNASTSAANAATSASAASTSASNAATSATNAANSATAASGSATSASGSASAAATSASNAAGSASSASTSASNAATSESNASGSASAAATSASNAATSESNAQAYELSANEWATKTTGPVAGGEYSAKYNAQLAATSASNASTSETNASASASTATTQAGIATTKASEASASASAALTSETNAASSASSASTSASNAATSATNASNSASSASTSASNAATSESNAATSASNAATSETNAASSASAAATSASNASSSASAASAAETAALAAQAAAELAYDSFDDRYLGAKSSDPTLDNDGNALLTGALYWSTASNELKIYNGTSWSVAGSSSGASVLDDTTTNATRYLTFADATTGPLSTAYVSSTKLTYNPSTGVVGGSISGNAGTVTDGVYTTGSYADPTWITSLDYSKLTGTIPTWNQNTTGNAATATALQTARTIGGVSFNGTANINLPGVNTAGNQDTSGNAATATTATNLSGGTVNTTGITSSGDILPETDNTGVIGNSANTWSNGQFTNLQIDSTLTVRAAIDLADNDVLRLGSSDDWEFFHNGTDNYIDLNVGNLIIRDNTTTRFTFGRTTGNIVATGSIDCGTQFLGLATDAVTAPSFSWTGDTNTGIYRPTTDTVGIVCGGTEDFRVDSTGQLWNTVQSQVGTDYTTLYKGYFARAWVNFNGTGTVAIRASGNVTSVTDNGTGDYTVNFTTAMPDANYGFSLGGGIGDATAGTIASYSMHQTVDPTTSALRMMTGYANTQRDIEYVCASIFR